MRSDEQHDVVIVGGGPAGVSCALECFDIQLGTVLVESDSGLGGQLGQIPNSIRNVAAGRFEDGQRLQESLRESAAILAGRVRLSHPVTAADLGERRIDCDGRRLQGRVLVVATGTSRQHLAAAADGAFGGDITYQLEAQPQRFVGRDVAVIGGGDSATLDALALARTGSSVKLIYRSGVLTSRHDIVEQVRDEPRIQELPGSELHSVHGTDRLEEISIADAATGERRSLAVGGLIIKISRLPNTRPFAGQVELDRAGAVVVDGELRTSREGVFAAGDVVSGAYPRVATALGEGVLAARSALRYLQQAS
jgi:thioredoxin reductase (NADPH)